MNKERQTWKAMVKFANNQPLNNKEWEALSYLTMIDKSKRYFGPGNVKWATTEAERIGNLTFYKSLGPSLH